VTDTLRNQALRGQRLDCPVVDIHVHSDRWFAMNMPCIDDAMIAKMDRVGVDLICPNPIIHPDVCMGNDRLAQFHRRYPDRVVSFAGLTPYAPRPMVDELRRCFDELGFVGIKVHVMVAGHAPLPFPLLSEEAGWDAVWELASERKTVVLYHGVVTPEVVRRYPDITFVHAHATGAVSAMAQLADCANHYGDTAWTQNAATAVDDLVRAVGVEHVLWGTDAPTVDFSHRLGVVLDSSLSEEDKRKVLGGNALRVLARAGYERSRTLG